MPAPSLNQTFGIDRWLAFQRFVEGNPALREELSRTAAPVASGMDWPPRRTARLDAGLRPSLMPQMI
jgi:hypothetical protein